MDLMPFDEINRMKGQLSSHFDENGHIRSQADCDDIIDEMLDLFLLAYANGQTAANEDLSTDLSSPLSEVMDTIDREIAGKTWRERVQDYYESGGTQAEIERIIDTEAHRDANEGAYNTASKAGATKKIWHCMMLPTSRDTHIYLDGVSAPIDGEFYSFNGGSTMFPGQWGIAEEDVNCLCWLTYTK